MTDKQLIKEEIKRRINNFWHLLPEGEKVLQDNFTKDDANNLGKYTELESLLKFINSLPEEPASENKSEKELAETYLAVFNKKYPILPTLKGKQKADFKNFLNKCQQEFGLKEFGIHPTQAKLFEKLTLLWATWGAEHLEGLGKSNQDEFDKEPASEDLEEAAQEYAENHFQDFIETEDDPGYWCSRFGFIAGAEWQKLQMMKDALEGEYWIGEIHLDTPIIQGYDDGDTIKFIPIKS